MVVPMGLLLVAFFFSVPWRQLAAALSLARYGGSPPDKKVQSLPSLGSPDLMRNSEKALRRLDNWTRNCNWNIFTVYSCLLCAAVGAVQLLSVFTLVEVHYIFYTSIAAEGFGLVVLRHRIGQNKSVKGISAQSVALFSFTYAVRAFTFPPLVAIQAQMWALKFLEWVSLGLILDVLRCMLKTYRSSYQEELDVVQVKHIVVTCFLAAFVLEPLRASGRECGWFFSFGLYLDQFVLLPQVVLMARQKCPVHAPIAHFVVATAFSRLTDLWYWTEEFAFWQSPSDMPWSGWYIMGLHVTSLLIVVDFLYYYVKAIRSSRSLCNDIPVDSAEV